MKDDVPVQIKDFIKTDSGHDFDHDTNDIANMRSVISKMRWSSSPSILRIVWEIDGEDEFENKSQKMTENGSENEHQNDTDQKTAEDYEY